MVIDDGRDLVVEECQLHRHLHNGSLGVVVEYRQWGTEPRRVEALALVVSNHCFHH